MRDLIERAKKGDPSALTTLVNAHKDLAFNLALGIVKDADDAKDVTQQSFLKVLEHIRDFRSEAKFSTWLFKIVYNESLKFNSRRSKMLPLNDSGHEELIEEDVSREEFSNKVTRVIEKLGAKEKLVLRLFYLGGKQIREIEQITGFSNNNVKVLLHRGRTQLRRLFSIEDD